MPKLVFTDQDFVGRTHDLSVEKTTVGRGHDNAVAIGHKSVSEHHAEILVNGLEVIVRDLGSTNGTSVAGLRVAKQHQVHPGQVIRFGSVEARLEFSDHELTQQQQDRSSEVTAVYEFRRYANAPPPPPPPPAHDEIVPASGPPTATQHTLVVPRVAVPAPAVPAPTPVEAPRGSTNWLVILLAVIVLGAVTGGVLWIFLHR